MKVCLDSRLIEKGDYFVPIKGENFDGHKFISQVLEKGASGILEEDELYSLAKDKLSNSNIITIVIAGAVGKSTFRSYFTQILSSKYKVLEGTLNTKLGLATTIINDLTNQQIFIAELGIDRIGEMHETSQFIKPDFVIYTKFEKEHLLYLKDLETAVKENITCIDSTKEKIAYINLYDKDLVKNLIKENKIIFFGVNKDTELLLQEFEYPSHEKDYLSCMYEILKSRFNYSDEDFSNALKLLKRPKGRLNLLKGLNNSLILDDSYNSVCDTGVIEGLKYANYLCDKYNKKLNIIVSPMRETGDSSDAQHKNVSDFINNINFKTLTVVGDSENIFSKYITKKYVSISSSNDVSITPGSEDLFYIKGSQFYRLEKAVEKILDVSINPNDVLVRQDVRWA